MDSSHPARTSFSPIFPVLFGISLVHLLNDIMQAVIPALFPILQQNHHLTYAQLGLISFANNMTASLMQPLIGWYTDKNPLPFLLLVGMACSLCGMICLAFATTFPLIILAVMFVGLGSAVFHPEGSRIVILSAGNKPGLGQSLFQVGGNAGQSLAPLLSLLVFAPFGQFGAVWFVPVAMLAFVILQRVSRWYRVKIPQLQKRVQSAARIVRTPEQQKKIRLAILLIVFLSFARSWFIAGIGNFYALFQMKVYGASFASAQTFTFVFLVCGALGTLFGGAFAERFGKKNVLIFSILGCAPFAMILPFVNGVVAYGCLMGAGFAVLTGFSVALIYAMDLMPGKTGTVSGLMFGLAFGLGALGAAVLGKLADIWGIYTMMIICCSLPLLGLVSPLLPDDSLIRRWNTQRSAA